MVFLNEKHRTQDFRNPKYEKQEIETCTVSDMKTYNIRYLNFWNRKLEYWFSLFLNILFSEIRYLKNWINEIYL